MQNRKLDEEAIFHVARGISAPNLRSEYLDQVCAGDMNLRQRVVALLEVHEKEQDFLKSADEPAPTLDQPVSEGPGTTIGRYKLLQKIGEGGFGVVFMAEQQSPVIRKVALKVIKPGMDSKAVVARFEAERQALALMDHANIAHILDGGLTDSGRPYFVMELVKGLPITDYCDKNELSTEDRLRLFIDVCRAVQHAHQKGVIHRDLKPSNILVTLHDGKPVPRVIDFGVSKALHQRLTEKTLFTAFGQMIGTAQYMSPEQAEMSGLDVDTRSDVYSLGVLLYELLTGTTPLEAESLREAGYAEIQRMIKETEPPRPSVRLSTEGEKLTAVAKHRCIDPNGLRKLIRGDLDWIVMKSLEKERGRRYESASDLAADVDRFLAREAVEAHPPSPIYRFRKFVRRRKSLAGTLATTAFAILLGLTGTTVGMIAANRALRDSEDARGREAMAKEEAERAQSVALQEAVEHAMNRAWEAWNRGNRNEFEELMRYIDDKTVDREPTGFNWRFLKARYRELSDVEFLKTDTVAESLSYHPHGSHLAIATADGSVIIRNCDSGESVSLSAKISGNRVCFSSRGTYICVSDIGIDRFEPPFEFQILHFPSLKQLDWQDEVPRDLSYVTISHDERLFAGVRADGTIELRETETGRLNAELPGHAERPVRLAFSPCGRFLASTERERGGFRLWSVDGESRLLCVKGSPNEILGEVVFAPDGQTVFVGGWQGTRQWQISGEEVEEVRWITESASTYSLAISNDGLLAVGSADQTVRLWDMQKGQEIDRLLHKSLVDALAFCPDGQTLAAGTRDNAVHSWRSKQWREQKAIRVSDHFASPIAIAPTGEVITAENRDDASMLKLWNPQTDEEVVYWTDSDARIIGVAISPDGQYIASASNDGTIRLGNAKTRELLAERKAHAEVATCVAFSLDSRTLVSAGYHSELLFWDLSLWSEDWESYQPQQRSGPGLTACLAFSPNGQLAIGGGASWNMHGVLMIWDDVGQSPRRLGQWSHPETIRCIAYSTDGKWMAITHKFSSGIIQVLDAATLEKTFEFQGHSNKVTALTFSQESDLLVSGSDDGTVRFWDLSGGKPSGTLQVGAKVRNLAMHPDRDTLLTLSLDGWLRQWKAAP